MEKEKVKREDLLHHLKTEIQFLMLIDHPNVVKLIEVLASRSKIYLVLEYISGGELWELISKSNSSESKSLIPSYRR